MKKENTKNIHIKVAGKGRSNKLQTIEIEPGVTVADMRRQLKLGNNFEAFRLDSDTPIQNNTDLYSTLNEGEKIVISPVSVVGLTLSLSYFFKGIFKNHRTNLSEKKMPHINSLAREPVKIKHIHNTVVKVKPGIHRAEILIIKPQKKGIPSPHQNPGLPVTLITPAENKSVEAELQNMGWKKVGSTFFGWFKDKDGRRYQGGLSRSWGRNFEAYIKDLPACVLKGQHRLCFIRQRNGWYSVHFNKKGDHPISLIKGIERCINDSLQYNGFESGFEIYPTYLPPDINSKIINRRLDSLASNRTFRNNIAFQDRLDNLHNPLYNHNQRRIGGDALW